MHFTDEGLELYGRLLHGAGEIADRSEVTAFYSVFEDRWANVEVNIDTCPGSEEDRGVKEVVQG